MIRLRRKKNVEVITTRDLAKYILETGTVPTPIYSQRRETEHIVQPRGTIFAGRKKRKPIKF